MIATYRWVIVGGGVEHAEVTKQFYGQGENDWVYYLPRFKQETSALLIHETKEAAIEKLLMLLAFDQQYWQNELEQERNEQ